jgi:hypothetical protein
MEIVGLRPPDGSANVVRPAAGPWKRLFVRCVKPPWPRMRPVSLTAGTQKTRRLSSWLGFSIAKVSVKPGLRFSQRSPSQMYAAKSGSITSPRWVWDSPATTAQPIRTRSGSRSIDWASLSLHWRFCARLA